jgi:hypothetical protein
VDDPYEPPLNPELVIDTVALTAEENADRILNHLIEAGFVLTEVDDEIDATLAAEELVSTHAKASVN